MEDMINFLCARPYVTQNIVYFSLSGLTFAHAAPKSYLLMWKLREVCYVRIWSADSEFKEYYVLVGWGYMLQAGRSRVRTPMK
jgi:hypothetical protein